MNARALERELSNSAEAAGRFASRYRGKVAELDAAGLAEACRAQEALLTPLQRILAYAELRLATDSGDTDAQTLLGHCHQSLATVAARISFFEVEWNAIGEPRATAFLLEEDAGPYRHFLESLRRYRPYQLSESEERLLAELSQSSTTAWERLFNHLVGNMAIEFEGGTSSLGGVLPILYEPDRDRRRAMHKTVSCALEKEIQTRAIVLNALVRDKAIRDRLRGYSHWLQSQNLANEVSDRQVRTMLETVSDRYEIVARYYRLKARLLGLEQLFDFDRYAPLPNLPHQTVEWEDASGIVLNAYESFSPRFRQIATEFFEHRWVDAPPRPRKQRGAFARATIPDCHPYVLINFTGKMRDIVTLAHELGHGVHMRLAQRQTLTNMDPAPVLAEVASLFCETLTFGQLLENQRDPGARLALLARYIEDLFVAVFRHTAMHTFEDIIHTAVQESGELDVTDIGREWLTTQDAMFGGAVTLTDAYGSWWSYLSHFFLTPGSLYAHVFGSLVALALYRRYQDGEQQFTASFLDILAAGGSQQPADLLSVLGVNLEEQTFWQDGLDILEGYVREAEQLADLWPTIRPVSPPRNASPTEFGETG